MKVNWTLKEAAARWGVSPSLVYKWVLQKRVGFTVLGGGEKRPMLYIITDSKRPKHAEHLTDAQRAVWPERKPVGATAKGTKSAKKHSARATAA